MGKNAYTHQVAAVESEKRSGSIGRDIIHVNQIKQLEGLKLTSRERSSCNTLIETRCQIQVLSCSKTPIGLAR